jgi:hypothetical protein
MVTTVTINDEAHTKALKKQLEFREKNIKMPSITELINKSAIIGLDNIQAI